MSTHKYYFISCEGTTVEGQPCRREAPIGGDTARHARDVARSHGWVLRNNKDLCPDCRTED